MTKTKINSIGDVDTATLFAAKGKNSTTIMGDNGIGSNENSRVIRPITERPTKGPRTNQLVYIRERIMKALLRNQASTMFKNPVDTVKLGIPNYYCYIEKPMDLGTIRERLSKKYYQNAEECLEDLRQMFCNAYLYNKPTSTVAQHARELELIVVRMLVDMPETEEVVPVGTKVSFRRSSDATTPSEICEDATVAAAATPPPQPECFAAPRTSLRLREVTKPEVLVSPVKDVTVTLIDANSSSSGSEDESLVDQLEKAYQRNQRRRDQQMAIINQQIGALNTQILALQEEDKEDQLLLLRHKGRRKRKFPLKAKNVSGVHVPAKKPKLPSSSSAAISKKKRTVPTVSLVKDVEAPTPGTSQSLVQAPAPASSRQMYSAELSELSSNMKRLSPEEMQEVLAIACPYVLDEDNEVDSGDDSDELRIDNLPGSCQWKIYDYVKDRISEKGMQAEPLGGSTYDNRNSDMPEEERAPAQVSPLPVLTKTKEVAETQPATGEQQQEQEPQSSPPPSLIAESPSRNYLPYTDDEDDDPTLDLY